MDDPDPRVDGHAGGAVLGGTQQRRSDGDRELRGVPAQPSKGAGVKASVELLGVLIPAETNIKGFPTRVTYLRFRV